MNYPQFLNRCHTALRETGPMGLFRRVSRVSLIRLQSWLQQLEIWLYDYEARARLSPFHIAQSRRAEARLRHLFAGRTVFILGTGPSINQLDLTRLKPFHSISVNSFFRHPILADWNPDLHCFMDGMFFCQSEDHRQYFADACAALKTSDFCVTCDDIRQVYDLDYLPYDRTFAIPTDGDMSRSPLSRIGLGGVLPCAPNVVLFAAVLAVLAGARTVVLLGADHDFLARPNPVQQVEDPHFYAGMEKITPPTDADADYNNLKNYLTTIQWCDTVWRCYYRLKQLARLSNTQIFNATPGSFLDVFDGVDYPWAVTHLPTSK